MRPGRLLRLSCRALFAHRMRASLALASVSAGVAAVMLTSAIGAGIENEIGRQIGRLGVNLLVVRPAQIRPSAARQGLRGTVTTLRMEDCTSIAGLPYVFGAAPGVERTVKVRAGGFAMKTRLLGTSPAFFAVRRLTVQHGRAFDDDDDRAARRAAVLGARVAGALFDGDPTGKPILIGGVPFDVIGVLAPKGVVADGDEDNQVVVPVRTVLRRVTNTAWLDAIFVGVRDAGATADAEGAIAAVMRRRHRAAGDRPPDFEILNASRFFTLQRRTANSLGSLTAGLAAIALLVGGTGIVGVMLLSVKERTGEIGLRTAVGATPRDILVQFLLEATVLALGGWTGGVTLALAGAGIVAAGTPWPMAAPLPAALISLAAVLAFGLGFGTIPARQASRIPPVRALLSK